MVAPPKFRWTVGEQTQEFAGLVLRVGSKGPCELRLDDPQVAAVHCTLESTAEGSFVLRPASSSHALLRNGRAVDGEQTLAAGDRLVLGDHSLTVELPRDQPGTLHLSVGRDAGLRQQLADLPLFAGLPPAVRRSLERFALFESRSPKEAFIRQNEYHGHFYVVLAGIVTAYRTEPDGSTAILDQLGPGQWFGELSALSNQPSPAKLQADTACQVAMLEPGLFKDLYKSGAQFRAQIDEHYRRRSLVLHLRTVPLLKGLSKEALRSLQAVARFEILADNQLVASEGGAIDAVYLIRSGAVAVHRADLPGEGLAGYLMSNSSFGEVAVLGRGDRWPGTYRTLMATDVLVLPIAQLRAALGSVPGALEQLEHNARQIRAEDEGQETGIYGAAPGGGVNQDELEIMVNRESAKGGEALVINLEKCVRCNACVESCVAVHEDRVPRLSKKGNRVAAGANELGYEISLVTSCYSCGTPGCMLNCSYGAIRRDRQGLVRFVWDNCVGCAMCVQGCPYDVIRLTAPPDATPPRSKFDRFLAELPLVGNLFAGPAAKGGTHQERRGYHKDVEVQGKAVKCDRCEGLPFEACVYNCPCGAIQRLTPAEIFGRPAAQDGAR
jgi:Fe-S-cluster-containing dehydrogenase component/CRP-like cAMP-binding protein